MVGTGGLFTWLLLDRISSGETYVARPWLGLGLIGAGFGLGYWHQSLEESTYGPRARNRRLGLYATIEVSGLIAWLAADG